MVSSKPGSAAVLVSNTAKMTQGDPSWTITCDKENNVPKRQTLGTTSLMATRQYRTVQ